MLIDTEFCVACGDCVVYCPSGAISVDDNDSTARIDRDMCFECYACIRSGVCPTDAFLADELEWPRVLRRVFSDPNGAVGKKLALGRGTAEMKTNDVTGRYRHGEVGMAIEVGRPGTGTRLGEIERFTTALAKLGVRLEKENPLTSLLTDAEGHMRPDVMDERVLSAIVEFATAPERVPDVMATIEELAGTTDTVFAVSVIGRIDSEGVCANRDLLTNLGHAVRPNAKINVGLGRPLVTD